MKFVLTYDGPLDANGRSEAKWEIRKHFHPQLKQLWEVHPALMQTAKNSLVSKDTPYVATHVHHNSFNASPGSAPIGGGGHSGSAGLPSTQIDLLKPFSRGGRDFRAIVTKDLGLRCSLSVQFLRAEPPGEVYQGGDMDNRLKTLFDSLAVPPKDQVIQEGDTTLMFCLLEDDALITGLSVNSQRYLSPPATGDKKHVRLLIEVDVRVVNARAYSEPFLGD